MGSSGGSAPEIPIWAPLLDGQLREAIRRAPLLLQATPLNFAEEVARLEAAIDRGEVLEPRFVHRRPADGLADLAASLALRASRLPVGEPLAGVYARRALQVCGDLHWALDLASGSATRTGEHRFPRRDRFDDEADDLAARWVEEGAAAAAVAMPPQHRGGPYRAPDEIAASQETLFERRLAGDVVTDDEADPRSLVSRMRAEIGARRLPVRVVVVRGIAPLAAAGDGVVQVSAGRRVTVADVERTVLHEVLGHLMPACLAAANPLGIFAIGTVHGSDDQEGRAVSLERRGGHLSALRKRTLGLRHLAAHMARGGAGFVDVVEHVRERGAMPREAVRLAARALRGGGLGREVVYIPALLRVEAAVAEDPTIDAVLAAGRVGVDDAAILAPWAASSST